MKYLKRFKSQEEHDRCLNGGGEYQLPSVALIFPETAEGGVSKRVNFLNGHYLKQMFFNAGGGKAANDKKAFTSFRVNGTEELIKKNDVIPSAVVNVYVDSERMQNSQTEESALTQLIPLAGSVVELAGSTVVFDEPITEDLGCVFAFNLFANNNPDYIFGYLDDLIDAGVITKIDERTIKITEKVLDIALGDTSLVIAALFPMEGDPENYVSMEPSLFTRSYTHTFTVSGKLKSVKEEEFILDITKVDDPNNWFYSMPAPKASLDTFSQTICKQYVVQLDEAVDPYQSMVGWFADDIFTPDLEIFGLLMLSEYIEMGLIKVSEDLKTLDFTGLLALLSLEFIYGFDYLPFSKLSFSIFTQISDTELKIVGNTTTFLEYIGEGLSVDTDTQFANIQWKKNTIPDKLFKGSSVTSFSDGAFEYFTTFGSSAFEGSKVNSIVIPDTVNRIGDKAFANCHNLQSFTLGANAVNVDFHSVFTGTTRIDNFNISPYNPRYDSRDNCNAVVDTLTNTIVKGFENSTCPDTIKTIGPSAFQGLSGMTQYTFGANVETIGEKAFDHCPSLNVINIPDSVISIANSAFTYCSNATVLTLGENVETIGNYAFNYCSSLTGVTFPGSVKTIGKYAFSGCSKLSAITIHDGVTSIGDGAFWSCTTLSSVTLPDTLTFIGDNAFYNTKLPYTNNIQYADNLVVGVSGSSGITSYTIKDGTRYIGNEAFATYSVQRYAKNIVIPSTVKMIGNEAFSSVTGLTSIALSEGLTIIGDKAFYNTNITNAHIPSTVTNIGVNPFCATPITSLTVAAENTVYRSESNTIIRKEDNLLVSGCKNSIIPQGVEIIGENAFYNRALTSVIIPDSVNTIKKQAFDSCGSITALTIGTGVETIEDYAFRECTKLSSITIPNSVKSIGAGVFYRCSGATELTIGTGVETIGNSAFYDCSNLLTITIPDSVKSIGNSAFESCDKLSAITIPNSIKTIEYDSFYGCSGATELTIGSNVETIGNSAFYCCNKLSAITIPDSVKTIESYAFSNCSVATEVTIGAGVETIGSYTFSGCSKLSAITIPDSVKSIESSAFSYCSDLNSITVSPNNKIYNDGVGCNVIITNDTLIAGSNNSIIPQHIKTIDKYAFRGRKMSSITIPDSVETIGDYAFNDCRKLSAITIPDSVETIGDYAFQYCSVATELTIGSSVETIGSYAFGNCSGVTSVTIPDSVRSIGSHAFSYCSSITSVTIPGTVKVIGDYAFRGCGSLTSLTIHEGVEEIGYQSFDGCKGVTELILPTTITRLGSVPDGVKKLYSYATTAPTLEYYSFRSTKYGTFYYPKNSDYSIWFTDSYGPVKFNWVGFVLDDTEIDMTLNGYDIVCAYNITNTTGATKIINNLTDVTEMEIDGVVVSPVSAYTFTTLGNHVVKYKASAVSQFMFDNVKSMYACKIAEGFTEIGKYAFNFCQGLERLPELPSTITSIERYAFANLYVIEDDVVVLPENLEYIGEYAFNNTYIKRVIMKSNLLSVGSYAFNSDTYLSEVVFQDSPATIQSNAFEGCTNITSLILSDNIVKVDATAFQDSKLLPAIDGVIYVNNVAINNNITDYTDLNLIAGTESIGNSAFTKCIKLTSVNIPDSVKTIEKYAFSDCSGATEVTIGAGVETFGEDAFYGCTNLSAITIPDSVKSIGSYAFSRCSGATELTIGSNVETIGTYAFNYCNKLSAITIPDSVKTLETYAFNNCSGATELTIGAGLETIGTYAFSGCSKLSAITIPDTVKTIGGYAFVRCSGATELTIGASVESIEGYAFSGCSSITSITIPDSVKYIGSYAFSGCGFPYENGMKYADTYLCGVESKTETSYTIKEGTKFIGNHAFSGCTKLSAITIPNSVKTIGYDAFYRCSGATELTIGSNVETIDDEAFGGCNKLSAITIPDSVKFIGNYAFQYCSGATELTIGSNVETIGNSAFSNCSGITSVTIPDSVRKIGSSAFNGCGFPYENGIKYADTYLCNVESKTGTTYTIKEGTKFIGSYAFSGCSKLSAITIPDSVKSIGYNAFNGCTKLSAITIPDSVKIIDAYAFSKCSGATELTIGSNVETIDDYAFSGCSSITSITIPDSVKVIGDYAFRGCSGATELTIGAGVETIEGYAFSGCSSITAVTIPGSVKSVGSTIFSGLNKIKTIKLTGEVNIDLLDRLVTDILTVADNKGAFYYPIGCEDVEMFSIFKSLGWDIVPYDPEQ